MLQIDNELFLITAYSFDYDHHHLNLLYFTFFDNRPYWRLHACHVPVTQYSS